jgi:UDP-glucose 6-dehydrogenase
VREELSAKERRTLPEDVKRLQKELEEARLYNRLLNAMIDIAEEQFRVPIRKKPGAKRR